MFLNYFLFLDFSAMKENAKLYTKLKYIKIQMQR